MSNQGSVAGWYPDPYDPSQLRYWDGTAWSEATAPATPAGAGPPGGVGPPASFGPPSGPGAPPVWPGASSNPLGDIGDWLGRTFSVVLDHLVAVLILLWAVPLVGYTVVTMLVMASVSDVTYTVDTEDFAGFRPAQLVIAGVVFLVTLGVMVVTYFTAIHQLHSGHVGRQPSLSQSLATGLRRLPRAILYGLAVGLGAVVIYLLLLGIPIGLIAVEEAFALLLLLTIPAMIVLFLFFWVRLSLLWVAVGVAPSGHNPITVSWRATANRFWAMLGRLLILGAIVYLAQTVAQFGLQAVLTPVIQDSVGVEIDPATNEVMLNGERLDDLEVVAVDDYLPNPAIVFLLLAIYTAVQAAGQALFMSGTAGLYVRLGCPDGDAAAGTGPPPFQGP